VPEPMRPSYLLGSATLRAGNGGIARAGRLTARALVDAGADVRFLSVGDNAGLDVWGKPVAISHGNKLRF
jgi:hypothetical protein